MVAEEWKNEVASGGWISRWQVALSRAYQRADDAFKDQSSGLDTVGSTALVVVVSACQVIASNCGDCRAVLCRGTQTIPLTIDHKPDRTDEVARIVSAGGKLLYWHSTRVEGVLAMTRAIGDQWLKKWIISIPEVTFTVRSKEDECLILASDGFWDVMSNEEAGELALKMLRKKRRQSVITCQNSSVPVQSVANFLLQVAREKYSDDNISVIVVDLKPPNRRDPRQP